MSSPYATGSLEEAKGHAHGIANAVVGKHATAAFAALIILVILVLYLFYDKNQWKAAAKAGRTTKKDTFGIAPYNNLNMGGNNPMWYLGSDHAGYGGDLMRDSTDYHVAEYHPSWRAGAVVAPPREGMTSSRGAKMGGYGPCSAGQTAVTVHEPDGSEITRCHNDGVGPSGRTCAGGWDPAAAIEAAALATTGGLKHEPRADGKLQGAINSAFDSSAGLTDDQLERLMHQGGTP